MLQGRGVLVELSDQRGGGGGVVAGPYQLNRNKAQARVKSKEENAKNFEFSASRRSYKGLTVDA